MSVTRTPLCSVKDCYIPEEMHYCWGQSLPDHKCFGGLTHQHRPRKGMGGNNPKAKVAAILCAGLHDQLDNNAGRPWKDEVRDTGLAAMTGTHFTTRKFYRIWNPEREHIESEWAPVWVEITDYIGALTGGVSGSSLSAEASNLIAPDTVPSRETTVGGDYETAVETSPNRVTTVTGPGGVAGTLRPFLDFLQPIPPDLSYEEWVLWGEGLGMVNNVSAWRIGEWLAYGEDRSWGQKYTDGMAATGKSYSTLSGYVWVVKSFEDLPVSASLSMSVLQAIAPEARRDKETGKALVLKAMEEKWTGTDAKRAVALLSGSGAIEHETRLCDMGYSHRV